ncbi:MAG: M23 family metallopeptidase, partial [Synergistaceae bacterium]|nr:M23 family metallopeptidase [Synergistaceae bacterium]
KTLPVVAAVLLLAAGVALADTNIQYPSSVGLGNPFAIRVTSSEPLTAVSALWQGWTIPLDISQWNDRYIALGLFGTQAGKVKTGTFPLSLILEASGKKREVSLSIKVTPVKYREDHLTLPENMVTPPASVLNRIAEERKAAGKALSSLTLSRSWGLPLTRPVDGIVTSPYGRRRILNGKPRAPHGGVDFRAATGTPVRAALPGRVVLTGDHYYAGKSVYIDSGGGVITQYFHLDSIGVAEGDLVKKGAPVGKSGKSGRVTGPHLHFGLSLSGQQVNPESIFTGTLADLLERNAMVKISLSGDK